MKIINGLVTVAGGILGIIWVPILAIVIAGWWRKNRSSS